MYCTQTEYDAHGNPISWEDNEGRTYRKRYNRLGQIVEYLTEGYSEEFIWDEYGNLLLFKSSDGIIAGSVGLQ